MADTIFETEVMLTVIKTRREHPDWTALSELHQEAPDAK